MRVLHDRRPCDVSYVNDLFPNELAAAENDAKERKLKELVDSLPESVSHEPDLFGFVEPPPQKKRSPQKTARNLQKRLRNRTDYDDQRGALIWVKPGHTAPQYIGRKVGWTKHAGYGDGRLKANFDGKKYYLHQLIFCYHHGYIPELVDHIDQNPLNNRIGNLRPATFAQNAQNQKLHADNKTGYSGVQPTKEGTWRAVITFKRKVYGLGTFPNKNDAIEARKAAEKSFGFHPNHGTERWRKNQDP